MEHVISFLAAYPGSVSGGIAGASAIGVKCNSEHILYSQVVTTYGALEAEEPNTDALDPTTQAAIFANNFPMLYNGSTFDRQRANIEQTILTSAARTANTTSSDFTNYNGVGLHLIIDVTSITDTPSIVPTIQGKDPVSNNYYDVLVGAAITSTGTNVLKVAPGIVASPNAAARDFLPRTWHVSIAHDDTDSITYSVGAVIFMG